MSKKKNQQISFSFGYDCIIKRNFNDTFKRARACIHSEVIDSQTVAKYMDSNIVVTTTLRRFTFKSNVSRIFNQMFSEKEKQKKNFIGGFRTRMCIAKENSQREGRNKLLLRMYCKNAIFKESERVFLSFRMAT